MKKEVTTQKFLHLKNCSVKRDGVTYPYYGIAESQFVNGKNQKRIIKYLGLLNEDQIISYRNLLKAINSGEPGVFSIEEVTYESSKDFLNVFVLHSIWERLGLHEVFPNNSKKELQSGHVAEILSLAKLVNPTCATKTVDWFEHTYLPDILQIDSSKYNRMKIFNELEAIDKAHEKIEQKLIFLSQSLNPGDFKIFFLDGTTTFFEGTHCDLAKPGEDKTTGYRSHIILILLVTDAKGYPVAWEVCSGNERETIKFQTLAERLCKKYKIKNFTFCFDRGFASAKNFNSMPGYSAKFISGLDKNQIAKVFNVEGFQTTRKALIEYHDNFDSSKKVSLPINGFYSSNGEKFFKELGVSDTYRHVVGFSVEICGAMQRQRQQNQFSAIQKISELNEELLEAKGNRDIDVVSKRVEKILEAHQMTQFINYRCVPKAIKYKGNFIQSCKIEVVVDLAAFEKASDNDGLFVYVTDHVEKKDGHFILSAYDIINHYRNKYIIEKDFRNIKNLLNLRPLFVRLDGHVRALITATVLGQFINVFIEQMLKPLEMTSESFLEKLKYYSPAAKLRGAGKTIIKHLQISEEVKTAIHQLGISDSHRSKIAAQLK